MPRFVYIVKDKDAQRRKGSIEALSKEEAIKSLQGKGFYVVSISELKERDSSEEIKIARASHGRIKPMDMALFARNLSTVLDAGVTLLRGLEISARQTESQKLSKVLKSITYDVRSGLSLAGALAKYPRIFSPLWRGLVETGEASGNLAQVLEKLAEYLELRLEFTRKIKSALIYPCILLVAAGGAVVFFASFILPRFEALFSQFGGINLPFLTRLVFKLGLFLKTYLVGVIIGGVLLVYLFLWWTKTPQGKGLIDRVSLSFPLIRNFFYAFYIERFSSTLFILLDSGVPVVYALEVAQKSIGNRILEKFLEKVKEKVKDGKPLSSELIALNFFPPMVGEMISIGEEIGELSRMFFKICKYFQTDLDTKIQRFISMFEPLMILVVGGGIAIIVVALYLPLFQYASSIR